MNELPEVDATPYYPKAAGRLRSLFVDCPYCHREQFFSVFTSDRHPNEYQVTQVVLRCEDQDDPEYRKIQKYIAHLPETIHEN
jgi:hypothetical protein